MSLFVLELVNYWPGTSWYYNKTPQIHWNYLSVFFLSLCGTNVRSPALWRLLKAKRCNCINSASPWKDERQHISNCSSTWALQKNPIRLNSSNSNATLITVLLQDGCGAMNAQIKDKLSGSDWFVMLGRDCSQTTPSQFLHWTLNTSVPGSSLEWDKSWDFLRSQNDPLQNGTVASSLGNHRGLWFTRSHHTAATNQASIVLTCHK